MSVATVAVNKEWEGSAIIRAVLAELPEKEGVKFEAHLRGFKEMPKRVAKRVSKIVKSLDPGKVKLEAKYLQAMSRAKTDKARKRCAEKYGKQIQRRDAYNRGWRKHGNGKSITTPKNSSRYDSLIYFANLHSPSSWIEYQHHSLTALVIGLALSNAHFRHLR